MVLSPLLFNIYLKYASKKLQVKPGETEFKWDITASGLFWWFESTGR
jgi:hypothetical protein